MQDVAYKSNWSKKVISSFLAFAIFLGAINISTQRAKAITLETIATVITFGELAYRVGKLGWDCWSLYKDISSPEEYYDAYDAYVSTLDSPIVTFSDTAFTPPLFLSDTVMAGLDEAVSNRYLYGYQFQGNHFELTLGNYASVSYGTYYWYNGACTLVSAPFTVSVTDTYVFDSGSFSTYGFSSFSYFYIQVLNEDGDWVNAHRLGISSNGTAKSTTVRLQTGLNYRFCVPLSLPSRSSALSGSYVGVVCYFDYSGLSISRSGHTVVPAYTRSASFMQTIANYNTTNNTTNYYIGTADANGSVNQVYDPDIFNEQTMIFKEPVTGEQYLCTGWKYSYSTGNRGYWLSLPENSYLYNGQSIRTVVLAYLDDALYIMGFRQELDVYDSIDDMSSDAVFLDKYDYVIATAANTTPEACQHVYTSETITAPTCTEQGVRRYTCSVCGETYKQYDGTGQPGPPGGATVSPSEESWFSWLASLFKKLISALVNGLASGLEYLVENVIVTVTDLLVQFTRWSFDLLNVDSLADWFNWFGDDNKYFTNDFGGSEVDVWAYS